jgi:phage-related protein
MTQPTFALPCEYGFTAKRTAYGQNVRISTTISGATPLNEETNTSSYEIKTVPIDNDIAVDLDGSLKRLRGSYFYSQFYFDDQQYKYRIIDDSWEWQVIGPTANVFTLQVERVYEPTVEFAIDYGQSQDQQVSAHIVRIATASGTAVPAVSSRSLKTASIRTKPMAKTAATALEATLLGLDGDSFYSQIYLDTAPRLYTLQPYQWKWTPEGEDSYVCEFTVSEIIANPTDIPCADQLNLVRTSRVRSVQFGDGYQQSIPDGINTEDYRYTVETLPLSDAKATTVESALSALKGNIFYAKFKNDSQVYKYRLDDNKWSWSSSGKNANVFQFTVKRAYDL